MLDDILCFVSELVKQPSVFGNPQRQALTRGGRLQTQIAADIGDLYCPRCGGNRRVRLTPLFISDFDDSILYEAHDPQYQIMTEGRGGRLRRENFSKDDLKELASRLSPTMYLMNCVQCEAGFTAVIHKSPTGASLAILPAEPGGLKTPHTPQGVAYYLDQAQRSKSVGANSAAVAMYRAAIEQLLLNAGYTQMMCGPKIAALENDIKAGTAPKWGLDLETEFLSVLKKLGDGAIHAGDIAKQASLDNELLDGITETMLYLLFVIYEAEHEKNTRLSFLKTRASSLKK